MTAEPEIHAFAHPEPARTAEPLTGGTVLITGTIGRDCTASSVAEALRSAPSGPVMVRINSAGGRAIEGIAIWALFQARGCNVIIEGLAASAASLIAMAGQTITMAPSALLMIHSSNLAMGGEAGEFRDAAERLRACDRIYARIYADRIGKSVAEIEALCERETWVSPAMALELGLADRIGEDEVAAWPAEAGSAPRESRERLSIADAHRLATQSGAQAFYRAMVATEAELLRLAFAHSPESAWAIDLRDRLTDRPAEPSAATWLEGRPTVPRLERGPIHFSEEWLFTGEAALMNKAEVASAWRAAARDKHLVQMLLRSAKNEFCDALWLGLCDQAAEIRARAAQLSRIDRCIENSMAVLALRESELTTINPLKGRME